MSSEQADTSRAVVQTYVPAYQRDVWDDHAEELGMSRSEFVRTMVQAGADPAAVGSAGDSSADTEDTPDASESTVRDRVIEALDERGSLSWDELREAVAGDIEQQIEDTLGSLQEQGQVRHSGRQGGYVLEGTDE